MTDDELSRMLRDARDSYGLPTAPLPERTWTAVEQRHFGAAHHDIGRRSPGWRTFTIGIAAALMVGVGLGRTTGAPGSDAARLATLNTPASGARFDSAYLVDDAFRIATVRHLGESVALLASFPAESRQRTPDSLFIAQARELLTTTRLLMDTPANQDPTVALLLDDLELVLAQVARLTGRRDTTDVQLITDALAERDLVPRLLSLSAD